MHHKISQDLYDQIKLLESSLPVGRLLWILVLSSAKVRYMFLMYRIALSQQRKWKQKVLLLLHTKQQEQ